jgi:hypothetical protein
LKFALGDGAGAHQQAVAEGALAVVDVGDDRKITNLHAVPKSQTSRDRWGFYAN